VPVVPSGGLWQRWVPTGAQRRGRTGARRQRAGEVPPWREERVSARPYTQTQHIHNSHTHTDIDTCTDTHSHVTHTHERTHINTRIDTRIHAHTHTQIHALTHTHAHTRAAHTQDHTLTHKISLTHTLTHTHTGCNVFFVQNHGIHAWSAGTVRRKTKSPPSLELHTHEPSATKAINRHSPLRSP